MQSILILAVLALTFSCALASNPKYELDWKAWKETHNKKYSTTEEQVRRATWEDNVEKINEHNRQADLGQHKHRLEVNKFTDMSQAEFVKTMNGGKFSATHRRNVHHQRSGKLRELIQELLQQSRDRRQTLNNSLPNSIDWRNKGYVTPVKDQGQCGSCWTFSTTGALEGQHFKKTGKLVSLSEQNLVDCSTSSPNNGCDGGLPYVAFQYIQTNNGIDTENSYPYQARTTGQCQFQSKNVGATVSGVGYVTPNDEGALQQAVANIGPISVGIDASELQSYESGVYCEASCSQVNLDHAVLVVGYGIDVVQGPYWLLKNSWGVDWGEQGYFRLCRNVDNQCGVAAMATYPIV